MKPLVLYTDFNGNLAVLTQQRRCHLAVFRFGRNPRCCVLCVSGEVAEVEEAEEEEDAVMALAGAGVMCHGSL